MYIICTDQPIPFFWTGSAWAHCVTVALRFDSLEEAEVERWNSAGTDSTIARVES